MAGPASIILAGVAALGALTSAGMSFGASSKARKQEAEAKARSAKLFGAVFADATAIKEKEIKKDIIKREILKNKHLFNLMQLSIILKPFLFIIIKQKRLVYVLLYFL